MLNVTELIDGVTWISPWPRYGRAELHLSRFRVDREDVGNAKLRPVKIEDADALASVFLAAFGHLQPYGSLDDAGREKAATKAIEQTFTGGDGVLAPRASFVALDEDKIVGAVLITLLPGGDPNDPDSIHWPEAPPTKLWDKARGQPHLTWIFVHRFEQGAGIGTLLLQRAVRVLRKQGYTSLWSTFLLGNHSSVLWHWRNGFELLPNLLSKRRMRRELKTFVP